MVVGSGSSVIGISDLRNPGRGMERRKSTWYGEKEVEREMVQRRARRAYGRRRSHWRDGSRLEENKILASVFLIILFYLSIAPLDWGK